MIQLDLFTPPPPVMEIDPRVTALSDRLISHLFAVKRAGLIVHQILHPDTLATRAPNLSDRASWTDPLLSAASVNAKRIRLFQHSPSCTCGRTVDVYTVEQSDADGCEPYINAYSVSDRGVHEMTVDHMLPKGFCGGDTVVNRVTKCRLCNHDKAVLMTPVEIELVAANLEQYTKSWANHEFVRMVLKFQEFIHTIDGPTRKKATKVLNVCAQSTHIRTTHASYKSRIKKMEEFMNSVNPPAPRPKVIPKLLWFQRTKLFVYDLLTFFPK